MLDINDLEKRWLQYKIKSYIPHAIIVISLVVIASIFTLFLPQDSKKVSPSIIAKVPVKKIPVLKQEIKKEIPPSPVQVEKKPIRQEPIPQDSIQAQSLKLKPSLNFIKKMQHSTQPYYNTKQNSNPLITQQPHTIKTPPKPTTQVEVIENDEPEEIEVAETVKKIQIKRRNTKEDIAQIIKRFKKNNNPALSLFIAKKYYELGEYHQSYNYALITNNINSEIEQSWIVFAKSLVKLNEKEMAMKTLKSYIKNSHSNSAQILLEEITSGKFR